MEDITSPSSSQRIVQELILYPESPLPHLTFNNAQRVHNFGALIAPDSLILNAAFSFTTTPGVNRLALLWEVNKTQVWHSNIKS